MSVSRSLSRQRQAWRTTLVALLLVALLPVAFARPRTAAALQQPAEDGAASFQEKCAACHTVGGGPLAGPDLQGVTAQRDREWLARWLAEPDKMLAEGDPIAVQLLAEYNNVPMPNMGLSEQQVTALIAYLEAQDSAAEETPEEPGPVTKTPEKPGPVTETPEAPEPTPELPTGDREQGQALFTSQASLSNGGPACMSCHTIAGAGELGGSLGPDLTLAFANYGGDAGMAAVLAAMPFPTMNPIYGDRPLTAEEQADLSAFLRAVDEEQTAPPGWLPVAAAGGGFVVLAGIAQVVWRRRLPGVRRFLREEG